MQVHYLHARGILGRRAPAAQERLATVERERRCPASEVPLAHACVVRGLGRLENQPHNLSTAGSIFGLTVPFRPAHARRAIR